MPRSQPQLKLSKNPIIFALGQVVISPVVGIASYVSDLQEKFRLAGYPKYEIASTQTIQFSTQGQPITQQSSRWLFIDRDRSSLVAVSPGSVVLEQNKYSTFDDFSSEIERVVDIVREVTKVELFERVGFRRVNLIEAETDLPLEKMLDAGLLGVRLDLDAEKETHSSETWVDTKFGRLMGRVSRPAPPGLLPPDLLSTRLEVREPNLDVDSAVLDIDHFSIATDDFRGEVVKQAFWDLHENSDLAFRSFVTTDALERWQRE